jgi:NADP-reducing hydrogenase subunit HndD
MEAALRTAVEWITGEAGGPVEFNDVRGTEGIKEASYTVGGLTVNVAVASGLANVRKVIEMIKSGEKNYQFVEFMACPGGCVNGGGQPHQCGEVLNTVDIRAKRAEALYNNDAARELRRSHENPVVKAIYDEYLEKPGSHLAHEILHTSYVARKKY